MSDQRDVGVIGRVPSWLPRPDHLSIDRVDLTAPGTLVASGGICAPLSPMYDLTPRALWEYPDDPWTARLRWHRWLFPRWTRADEMLADVRSRLRRARQALRTPMAVADEEDLDW